jgi:hypothetical protein
MTALQELVQAYVTRPAVAGTPTVSSGFDRAALQRELGRLRKTREIAFWLCVGILLLLFLAGIVATIAYRNDPAHVNALSAATGGVTLMGLVTAMNHLWQQKAKIDLVMALVAGLSEDALKAALATLLAKL